ncbi:HAD family hydrolase [Streptosporangium roseum]|uniref:HAD family hydrolase n=1 Tax=Streptosporangium roseum TaxID=2001 RepID=UPI0033187D40
MEGLVRLRASGWKVAIVTSGMADNQLGKIQRTGLAEAVDAYALSGAEGVRKPDVGLFEIAARRCGMALAGGGWMVGDHLIKDIGGDGPPASVRFGSIAGRRKARSMRRTTSLRTCSRPSLSSIVMRGSDDSGAAQIAPSPAWCRIAMACRAEASCDALTSAQRFATDTLGCHERVKTIAWVRRWRPPPRT